MWPEIQLVVLAGRETVNPHLRRWAERFDHARTLLGSELPDLLACRRNLVLRWFRDESPPQAAWLLMMDDDCVPVAETDELLRCRADVASARVWARTGAEAHPHALSAACLKLSRAAVAAIRPPWFRFTLAPDGTAEQMCECRYFWLKAQRAGFRSVRAGVVGHRFPVTVLPPADAAAEGGRPRFLFDSEVADGQV
jgi:hypothetical protein